MNPPRAIGLRRSVLLNFILGLLTGVVLTLWLGQSNPDQVQVVEEESLPQDLHNHDHGNDGIRQRQAVFFDHEHEESNTARELKRRVKLLCWIMTGPRNLAKAIAVNRTWGQKCDKLLFITANSTELPSVDLNVTSGRNFLWQKTKRAFKYIHDVGWVCFCWMQPLQKHLDQYDWFLKADDDTFFIVENLRFMLLAYRPEMPVYFGCKFRPLVKQGYMSGGSGYVLSREALQRFVEVGLQDQGKCKRADGGAEDVELGKCMMNVGVVAGDSRDANGRHRMLPLPPTSHFDEKTTSNKSLMPSWFYSYIYYPYDEVKECCSDYVISFHYVGGNKMYSLFNMIYHIRAFGVTDQHSDLPARGLGPRLLRLAQRSARPFEDMRRENSAALQGKRPRP